MIDIIIMHNIQVHGDQTISTISIQSTWLKNIGYMFPTI